MLSVNYSVKKVIKSLGLLAVCLSFSGVGLAGPIIPDAADIPRPLPSPPTLPSMPEIRQPEAPTPPTEPDSSVRLVVQGFVFSGNKAFDDAQLSETVVELVGQPASLATLQLATKKVTAFYRKHGYLLAVAYLPAQDIQQNTVEIAVLEGELGELKVNTSASLNQDFLSRMANYQLAPNALITERTLVRNMTQLNALPGLDATAQLNPGASTGSSDVEIELKALPTFQGVVGANTYGNRFTGRETLQASLAINNLAGVGDQWFLSLRNSNDDGQRAVSAAYVMPIHPSGTLLSAQVHYVDYQLGGPFKQIEASGDSQFFIVGVEQPLFRNAQGGLSLQLGLAHKRVDDEIEAFSLDNERHINTMDFGLMGDWFNADGDVSYQLGLLTRAGKLNFKNAFAQSLDASGTQTEGSFVKYNLTANRIQYFNNGLSFALRADYQHSTKNLDSVEKLMIGGINRWRAFAELPSQADTGIMTGAEVRKTWQAGAMLSQWKLDGIALYGFLDYGRGRLNRDALNDDNHVRSTSLGVGTDWTFIESWWLGLTLSQQARRFDGLDTERETRLWGHLQKAF